jgi:hypothetical protein
MRLAMDRLVMMNALIFNDELQIWNKDIGFHPSVGCKLEAVSFAIIARDLMTGVFEPLSEK